MYDEICIGNKIYKETEYVKDINITINSTEVKAVRYSNNFSQKQGEKISMQIQNSVSVKLNPANPVMALVFIKVEAKDETNSMAFEIETLTGVMVNTFVDNLDDFVRKYYVPSIQLAVNEKVRSITAMLGLTIKLPAPQISHNNGNMDMESNLAN